MGFQALDSALDGNTGHPGMVMSYQMMMLYTRSKRLFGGSHKNSHANGHTSLTCSICSWLMEGMQNWTQNKQINQGVA